MDVEDTPSKRTIAVVLGGIAAVALAGLFLLGGQVSSILSNVGNSIVGAPVGDTTSGDTTGNAPGGDTTGSPDEPSSGDVDGKGDPIVDVAAAPELLIIRTGQLEIEVADLDAAVAGAQRRVAAVGGYVSSSDASTAGDDSTARVTFRIPAERWDSALAAVQDLATTRRHLHVETQAVTNEVIDLGARIANLRATEAALQKIMEQATRIPDVLEVQGKLTEVRGEIERLAAQKVHLEEQAAYGTLSVVFALPAPAIVEAVKAGWDPAADADAATGTLIGLGQRLASLGIWVGIVGLPIALGLGLLVVASLIGWRLARRAEPGPSEP